VATFRGRRLKLRYRGVAKNHAWLKRRTAALNLRNLIGRGLTRRDAACVLAAWPGDQHPGQPGQALPGRPGGTAGAGRRESRTVSASG